MKREALSFYTLYRWIVICKYCMDTVIKMYLYINHVLIYFLFCCFPLCRISRCCIVFGTITIARWRESQLHFFFFFFVLLLFEDMKIRWSITLSTLRRTYWHEVILPIQSTFSFITDTDVRTVCGSAIYCFIRIYLNKHLVSGKAK